MTEHEKAVDTAKPPENLIIHNFYSDKVDLEVKTAPKCRVTLTIKAKKAVMDDAKKDAIKQVSKEVSIPGFRKGKAPASLIETKYPGAITKAWDGSFADFAFKEGQNLARIPVLNGSSKINYQVTSLKENEGEVSFQFEREPEVPAIDYSAITLKDTAPVIITDENVDNTIRSIQMFYAKWNQVTERAVQEGDFVVLDIDDLDGEAPVPAFSGSRFEVAKGKMADWMREAVLGKNLNEAIECVSQPDEKESEEVKKEFKHKKVKITIKGVEEAILPPFDDEFAKRIGASTVDELKSKLKKLLKDQEEFRMQSGLREEITDEILLKVNFEVPGSMLEQEANYRMSQLFKQPDFLKKWKSEMSEEEKEAKKAEIIKHAEDAIKLFYLSRKILAENNLGVTESDLNPNYESLLDMMFADQSLMNYKNQSEEHKAITLSKHMMAKAQDFIIAKIRSLKI